RRTAGDHAGERGPDSVHLFRGEREDPLALGLLTENLRRGSHSAGGECRVEACDVGDGLVVLSLPYREIEDDRLTPAALPVALVVVVLDVLVREERARLAREVDPR